MALSGKLIGHVDLISSTKEDIYNLFTYNPNEIAVISPTKCQACNLLDGDRGAVGSVISWDYTHEGKKKICKQIIAPDDIKPMIVFTVIGGDLVEQELYKSFTIILDFETGVNGEVANWTFVFEKPEIIVPYPTSMMDFLCDLVKDLDTYSSAK